jgi:Cu+-exporting ATPase
VKILNKFLTVLLIAIIFVSCDTRDKAVHTDNQKEAETQIKAADVKTVQLEIKGMTCEIGCAKLIQSKLYKTDGVTFAEVHFADSSGVVTYDANRLSEKDLVQAVEKAGGGDLYTVSSVVAVASETATEEAPEASKEESADSAG